MPIPKGMNAFPNVYQIKASLDSYSISKMALYNSGSLLMLFNWTEEKVKPDPVLLNMLPKPLLIKWVQGHFNIHKLPMIKEWWLNLVAFDTIDNRANTSPCAGYPSIHLRLNGEDKPLVIEGYCLLVTPNEVKPVVNTNTRSIYGSKATGWHH